jgi:uncharacterized protein YggE
MRVKALLTAVLVLAAPTMAIAQDRGVLRQITVSGEAEVLVVPDMATISVGSLSRGDTAAQAMDLSTDSIAAILARLTENGIEARDIQTSSLSLREDTYWDRDKQIDIPRGFLASNSLTVRVRDLDQMGKVIGLLIGDGANRLTGLSFGIQDAAPLEDEARRRAVKDALHKAGIFADAAGVKLGAVLTLSDTASPAVSPMARGFAEPMVLAEAAKDVPIAAGEISARAEVTMVIEILDEAK